MVLRYYIKEIWSKYNTLSFKEFNKHMSHWDHPYNLVLYHKFLKTGQNHSSFINTNHEVLQNYGKNGLQLNIIFDFKDHLYCIVW